MTEVDENSKESEKNGINKMKEIIKKKMKKLKQKSSSNDIVNSE